MEFLIEDKKLNSIKADVEVIFIVNQNLEHKWVDKKDKDLFEMCKFKAKDEESIYLIEKNRVYVAIKEINHESLRIASSIAIKKIKATTNKSVKIGLYQDENCAVRNIKAMVEGMILGSYKFENYKKEPEKNEIEKIIFSTEDYSNLKQDKEKLLDAISRGEIVANCVNFARDIVNTPPKMMTPKKLAKKAKDMAEELNLEAVIHDDSFLKEQGMGAFLAVSRASSERPRLIHLTYKAENPKLKLALVGKGLTYDSGGLSLKPSDYMATMKADKSGAVATLAIMKAVASMKLPIELDIVIGACENMIGGNAYKPDDVLTAKNGKTIEVKNTDAEGRLVLADCLCYAQELKPDFIFDMATLTGACIVALGEYTFGVMGHNKELKNEMIDASNRAGELSAELPFNKYLPKLIKSQIADVCNISSSRYGGAITAGLFLSEFIDEEYKDKWLHLDIAGPSFVEKEWDYNPFGASGAGIRSVIKWIETKCREK